MHKRRATAPATDLLADCCRYDLVPVQVTAKAHQFAEAREVAQTGVEAEADVWRAIFVDGHECVVFDAEAAPDPFTQHECRCLPRHACDQPSDDICVRCAIGESFTV